MTKPLDNPFLKQLVAGIASKANQGRINDLTWGSLNEARKKKNVKEGNMAPKKAKPAPTEEEPADETPADDVAPAGTEPEQGNPDLGGEPKLPPLDATAPTEQPAPQADAGEDATTAKADAVKAKAELEKAKAEKEKLDENLGNA